MKDKMNWSLTRVIALLGIVAVIVALATGIAGCGKSDVSVAEVKEQPMPIQLEADANVTALNKATIQPSVGGQVAQFMVKTGDTVSQGQVVALLDTSALQSQLSSLQQKLAEAQSVTTSTTTTTSAPTVSSEQLALAEELRASGNITQKQYDSIVARSRGTSSTTTTSSGGDASAIAGIQASIAKVQMDINNSQIVAPIAGTVTAIYNEDRKIAIEGRPFMMIQQATPIVASLSLPQSIALALASDMGKQDLKVYLVVDEQKIPGEVTFIDTNQPTGTPSVLVKATFNNEAGVIKVGEFYPLHIESSVTAPMLTVPQEAVRENADGHYVYVVTEDNTVDVRAVQIGETVDGIVAILSGVQAGERVITTSGMFELGQSVTIKD